MNILYISRDNQQIINKKIKRKKYETICTMSYICAKYIKFVQVKSGKSEWKSLVSVRIPGFVDGAALMSGDGSQPPARGECLKEYIFRVGGSPQPALPWVLQVMVHYF